MDSAKPEKFGTDALMNRLEAEIKKAGIHTYILIAVDPDSDADMTLRSGSLLWAVGAVRATEQEMIRKRMATSSPDKEI